MPESLDNKQKQLDYLTKMNVFIASACNKMIRTELLKDSLVFRVGMLSEDIEWCARLMQKAVSMDYINLVGYVYRQRNSSITHTMKEKNCYDLTSAIENCFSILKEADEATSESLKRYIAYQYSTFFAVQAIAERCPDECIDTLSKYSWILKYHANNRKIRILYIGCRILGFRGLCKLVRRTKFLWGK